MSLPPELDIKDGEDFDEARLGRAFGWIAGQLRTLQGFQPSWIAAVNEVAAHGLARIEEVIKPAYERVMALTRFGFLIGSSTSSVSLAVGDRRTFVIVAGEQRDLFTPTAFVAITRVSTPDEWAIGRIVSYNASTGELVVVIEASNVSAGAHDDWQVTASAGSVVAAIALLADTRAARDAADLIRTDTQGIKAAALAEIARVRDAANSAKDVAVKAAKDANAAAVLIEGGPVASVNGRTGNIALVPSDIPGLEAALEDRYTKAVIDERVDQKVNQKVAGVVDSAPSALDTLGKMAGAIGNNPNFAAQMGNSLAAKANKAGDVFTGSVQVSTGAHGIVGLIPGTPTNTGYVQFVTTDGVRRGYIGYGSASGKYIEITAESGWTYQFNTRPSFMAGASFTGNVSIAGSLTVAGMGDVSQHVENRANAYQQSARDWTYANFVLDVRQAGWYELGNTQDWTHSQPGGYISSMYGGYFAAQSWIPTVYGGRWLQKCIAGNWYTVGHA